MASQDTATTRLPRPDVAAHWLRTGDGLRLRIACWAPAAPRGTVLLFPGRTEYVEKYGPAAREFAEADLATIAIDWRGQGLSDRLLEDRLGGHVAQFGDYQRDVAALVRAASALDLPRPWHLLGHSMGGAIGLRALMEGLDVATAAFSSPMWGIDLAPALRPVALGLSWAAGHAGLDHHYAPGTRGISYPNSVPFAGNLLTCDAGQFNWMRRQIDTCPQLALGGPSVRWLGQALRDCRALAARPAPHLPCLTVLGTDEGIVDPRAIHARMAAWSGGRLMPVPGGRHETMMETPDRRSAVFDALRAHMAG